MAVDAVPRDIEDAVLEPFDRNVPGREGCVLDLGERLHPADALGLLGPEPVGILDRARIHLLVLGLIGPGALGPFRRHIINFLGHLTPSTHAPREKRTQQAVFIVTTIMRRAGQRRQAERIRPSARLGLRRIKSEWWNGGVDRPCFALCPALTIALPDGQNAALRIWQIG